ncbi:hypothetical protein ACLOJK_033441 [Asimina triloba]
MELLLPVIGSPTAMVRKTGLGLSVMAAVIDEEDDVIGIISSFIRWVSLATMAAFEEDDEAPYHGAPTVH